MKRLFLCLLFVLFVLTACGDSSDEIELLRNEIAILQSDIANLHNEIAFLEEEVSDYLAIIGVLTTSPAVDADVLAQLFGYLEHVQKFLGLKELAVAEDGIILLHDNIIRVAAETSFRGFPSPIELLFSYEIWGDTIHIRLISYHAANYMSGGEISDGGKSAWFWENENLFEESFTIKALRHDANFFEVEYYAELTIEPDNWESQIIAHFDEHLDIRLFGIWYEDDRLLVNLTPESAIYFNWGSTGGYIQTLNLIESLATLPNVYEIEVLVGGRRNEWADHFSFAQIFRIEQDNIHQ